MDPIQQAQLLAAQGQTIPADLQRQVFQQAAANNMSSAQLEQLFNMPAGTAAQAAQQLGIANQIPQQLGGIARDNLGNDLNSGAAEAAQAGMDAFAAQGASTPTVQPPSTTQYTQAQVDSVVNALNSGQTTPEQVAKEFGVTADEVRSLKSQLDAMTKQFEVEQAANKALEEERQRLRDIADRLRGLLDARDGRLGELEEQLERVMQGPRSVSAEHDYLVEQIEELKRRLLERNREYESLRRRERRLHNDVFERDERIQQMSLTLGDMESALQDRTAELREIEGQRETMTHQLDAVRRGERTREVVGRVFADSLSLVRSHDEREMMRENYANSPDVERKLTTPDVKDMAHLAGGGRGDLDVEETDIEQGMDVDTNRPAAPGGSGDPVIFDDED